MKTAAAFIFAGFAAAEFPFSAPQASAFHNAGQHTSFSSQCFNFAYGLVKETGSTDFNGLASKAKSLCHDETHCSEWADSLAFVVSWKGDKRRTAGPFKTEGRPTSYREWCHLVEADLGLMPTAKAETRQPERKSTSVAAPKQPHSSASGASAGPAEHAHGVRHLGPERKNMSVAAPKRLRRSASGAKQRPVEHAHGVRHLGPGGADQVRGVNIAADGLKEAWSVKDASYVDPTMTDLGGAFDRALGAAKREDGHHHRHRHHFRTL